MPKKFATQRVSAFFVNNTSTSAGSYYITSDQNDSNKLKIGHGNDIGKNVALTIDTNGLISGSSFTGGSFSGGSFTGSFEGDFTGDGDGLNNLNVNIDGTAAVNIGEFFFDKSSVSLSAKPAIKIEAQNMDAVVCRVDNDGLDLGSHGFSIKYMGSRSGNDNSLSFFSDNELAATQIEALTIVQDGKIGIGTHLPKVPLDIYEMGGLILGMTSLDNGGGADNANYTCTDTFVVPTSDWKVTFVAPQSGQVEIQFNGYMASGNPGDEMIYLGLSTSSTYASLGSQYEVECAEPDEDDNSYIQMLWPLLTGLVAGTTYTYYVGTRATDSTGANWRWGGTDSLKKPVLTIRAISLPNTIHTD